MPSSSIAGRKARVFVAADTAGVAGTYNALTGIKSFQHSIDGAVIDDSEFGIEWVQRIVGLLDGKITFAGGRRPDDTTGQEVVKAALINGSFIWIKILLDGTNGFTQRMICTKFGTDTDVADKSNLQVECMGSGPITAIP